MLKHQASLKTRKLKKIEEQAYQKYLYTEGCNVANSQEGEVHKAHKMKATFYHKKEAKGYFNEVE